MLQYVLYTHYLERHMFNSSVNKSKTVFVLYIKHHQCIPNQKLECVTFFPFAESTRFTLLGNYIHTDHEFNGHSHTSKHTCTPKPCRIHSMSPHVCAVDVVTLKHMGPYVQKFEQLYSVRTGDDFEKAAADEPTKLTARHSQHVNCRRAQGYCAAGN